MSEQEVYLALYKENRDHVRHHESQRTTMSNLVLVITAGIGSVISIDEKLTVYDLPFSLFIIILGLFGVVFTKKYGSRLAYHLAISRKMLESISLDIFKNLKNAGQVAEERSEYSRWIRAKTITQYWVVIHSIIVFIGIALSTFIVIVNFIV